MAPRSSMLRLLAVLAMLALAAQVTWAAEGLDTVEEPRRSLLTTAAPAATKCPFSNIREQCTVKIAVLIKGVAGKPNGRTYASEYFYYLQKSVKPILDRFNNKFHPKPALSYSYAMLNDGFVVQGQQKWFYYNIVFYLGKCGTYKDALEKQLKVAVRPSAAIVKKYNIESWPCRA